MKKFVALLLAFSGFLLSACNGGEKLAEISEYTADGFVDPNTGVEYVTARGGRTLYAVAAGEKYLTAADTCRTTAKICFTARRMSKNRMSSPSNRYPQGYTTAATPAKWRSFMPTTNISPMN